MKFHQNKKIFLILLMFLLGGLINGNLTPVSALEDDAGGDSSFSQYSYVEPRDVLETAGSFNLKIYVRDNQDQPVANKEVKISAKNKEISLPVSSFKTDKAGLATINIKFNSGISKIELVIVAPTLQPTKAPVAVPPLMFTFIPRS